jgi:NAD(P)-dependent dehydrogenase (short-subunit alcohol dehydrogenase family)
MEQHYGSKPIFPDGVSLVIGGSGGLGSAICNKLASQGSNIAITYNSNEKAALSVEKSVKAFGHEAKCYQMEIINAEVVKKIVDNVVNEFGTIHTLIFTVGPDIGQPFISEVSPQEWSKVISLEPVGYFNVVQATLPHLRSSQGSIVAITSAATIRYAPRDILSAAPKASVNLLTSAIAREEGRNGVRANVVAPGFISAGLGQHLLDNVISEREKLAIERASSLRRIGTAEEVAEIVAFLASSKASLITGQIIAADGGYTA